jgi:hypothetical protein
VFAAGALASAALVVLSLIRATNVLVTRRASRAMFAPDGGLPLSLLFNGGDTLRLAPTFTAFRSAVRAQNAYDAVAAAEAELWIVILQHRHRYSHLRASVRLLQYAAVAFLILLTAAVVTRLMIPG